MQATKRPYQETRVNKALANVISAERRAYDTARWQRFLKQPLAAAFAVMMTLAGTVAPSPAEAGALASAARGAIAKRAAVPPPMAFGKRAYGKPRDVVIQRSKHPQAAAHIEHAQKNGQPSILHIDRGGAAKRRPQAIGTVNRDRKPAPKYQRDEYPPAFTKEGGANSNVRWIRQKDNAGAGSTMRWQTHDLPDGSKIRILVK
jgi:hypothetical protein